MYFYSSTQWILLFFAYAFAGYLWEEIYVSLRQHKLVNRGFLHGPVLPIYGFGAIIILFTVLPVIDNWCLIFILGMCAATVLEYITGALLNKIFKMRYWDYSNDFANVRGYICLRASLAWGAFSLLLVNAIHPLMDRIVLDIPYDLDQTAAVLLICVFTVDCIVSVQQAWDVRTLLISMAEENQEIQQLLERVELLKRRRDAIIAFSDLDQNGVPDILEDMDIKLKEHIQKLKEKNAIRMDALKRVMRANPSATNPNQRMLFQEIRSYFELERKEKKDRKNK